MNQFEFCVEGVGPESVHGRHRPGDDGERDHRRVRLRRRGLRQCKHNKKLSSSTVHCQSIRITDTWHSFPTSFLGIVHGNENSLINDLRFY